VTSLLIFSLEEADTETTFSHLAPCHCQFRLLLCLILLLVALSGVDPVFVFAKCKSMLLLISILIDTHTYKM